MILVSTVLILIGLLTFLFIQDSRQHAVVSSSIMQAKTDAKNSHPDRMTIDLLQAHIAESDRQEAVLFVIGLITVLGTVLAAVHFTWKEQTQRPLENPVPPSQSMD